MAAPSQGKLLVVATPIGNLDDISARALEMLRGAELVLCEDTRVSRRLLDRYRISAHFASLHEHNEKRQLAGFVRKLREGCTLALISDAGTPTVSDPGQQLVSAAHAAGIKVISVPGPNAAITALAGSGMEADQFVFVGFLPSRRTARCARLKELQGEMRTMVFYEAPHRIEKMLEDLALIFGNDRRACLAKELTKVHERFICSSLCRIRQWLADDVLRRKGEFVVVVEGAPFQGQEEGGELTLTAMDLLIALLEHLPARTAVNIVSRFGGGKCNKLYQAAMKIRGNQ